jgi:Na+-translocating ferredoxin:NAD+ oxidoreductase RnfG subunit
MSKDQFGIGLIHFKKTGANQWQTRSTRGYQGTVDFLDGHDPKYRLTINPGAVVTYHDTLGLAKSHFIEFLHGKPLA